MVEGSLGVLGKLRRKRVVVQLLRLTRGLVRLREGTLNLDKLLRPPVAAQALPRAAALLRECREELAQLKGIAQAQQLEPKIREYGGLLSSCMDTSLLKVSCEERFRVCVCGKLSPDPQQPLSAPTRALERSLSPST